VLSQMQQNFDELEGQYNGLKSKLAHEQEKTQSKTKELQLGQQHIVRLESELKGVRRELEDASVFKEKYQHALMSIEQLKGRIETSRKDVADLVAAHQLEVEQLRSQCRDAMRRMEAPAEHDRHVALRSQAQEMEERCAIVNGKRIEERERGEFALVSAHTALRDAQAKNIHLEEQMRSLDNDVHQMKMAMRRSMQMHTEAVLAKEKAELNSERYEVEAQQSKQALQFIQERLRQAEVTSQSSIDDARSRFEDEKQQLLIRITQLSARVDENALQQNRSTELAATQLKQHQRKLALQHEEHKAHLDQLERDLSDERDRHRKSKARLQQQEAASEALNHEHQQLQQKLMQSEQSRQQLLKQMDALAQKEAWAVGESQRLMHVAATADAKSMELHKLQTAHEDLARTVERLNVEKRYLEVEIADAKRETQDAILRVHQVESEMQQKSQQMYRQLQTSRKHYREVIAQNEAARKKLISSLVAKQTIQTTKVTTSSASGHHHSSQDFADLAAANNQQGQPGGANDANDPLEQLRQQTVAAQRLREQVKSLQRHHHPIVAAPTTAT